MQKPMVIDPTGSFHLWEYLWGLTARASPTRMAFCHGLKLSLPCHPILSDCCTIAAKLISRSQRPVPAQQQIGQKALPIPTKIM